MNNNRERNFAAQIARQLISGKINYDQFLSEYPDDINDKDVDELFSLLEHQPKPGGFLGVSQDDFTWHLQKIDLLIKRLEK